MIENLTKEKKLLSDNMCARHEIITESTDEIKEIIEPYDEEKELAWRGKLLLFTIEVTCYYI